MLEIDMTAPRIDRLISHDAPLDLIANDLLFGEGPLWSRRERAFYFVDIVGDTRSRGKPNPFVLYANGSRPGMRGLNRSA